MAAANGTQRQAYIVTIQVTIAVPNCMHNARGVDIYLIYKTYIYICDVSCENQTKCAFYSFEKNDHEHGTRTFNGVRVFYIS